MSHPRLLILALGLPLLLGLSGCRLGGGSGGQSSTPAAPAADVSPIGSLRLIGEQRIASSFQVQGQQLGGLSSLDYDAKTGQWLAISDDKSDIAPARFYTLNLDYDAHQFHSWLAPAVTTLRQADGSTYPNAAQYQQRGRLGDIPDLEALRVDPLDGTIWYTSEGLRQPATPAIPAQNGQPAVPARDAIALKPFVRHATRDGVFLGELPLPAMFSVDASQPVGIRQNTTFEGLSFSVDGKTLWLAMEGPLYQDGPMPDATHGAYTRISQLDRSGKLLAQYAYPIEPIGAGQPGDKGGINSVSEVLAVDANRLLMLERGVSIAADGSYRLRIRLYEADIRTGSDVGQLSALAGASFTPLKKRLVPDSDKLGLSVRTLEGMSWGPRLANGHRSLALVADNDFIPGENTQLLVFDVLPQQ